MIAAFIAGWIIVVFALAINFRLGTEFRSELALLKIAQVAVCFGICTGISFCLCRVALRKLWTDALGYTLIAAITVAGIGMAVNLGGYWQFPGTFEQPYFGIAEDIEVEWMRIFFYQHTGNFLAGSNIGFTWFASLAVNRLGPGISGLLNLNIAMMCGTIAATAGIASTLFNGANRKKTALYSAIAISLVSSLIWYATIPLKETGTTFSFTLFSYGIARLYKGNLGFAGIVAAAAGGFLLMFFKSSLGWILLPGIILACLHRGLKIDTETRKTYLSGIYLLLITCGVIIGGGKMRFVPDTQSLFNSEYGTDSVEASLTNYPTVERYATLIPGYFTGSPLYRLSYLPLAATAQFFPPFPWNFTRDTDEGKFVWYAHLNFFWYILAGAAIGYICLCLWRKKLRGGLATWTLWWVICYLGVAYFSGGSVPRYYLPFIPCLVPVALQFVKCIRKGEISRRNVVIYCSIYGAALTLGLVLAYNFLVC